MPNDSCRRAYNTGCPKLFDQQTTAVHRSLVPGGYMMLSQDADATPDPSENETILSRFEHKEFGSLSARNRVVGMEGHDHVFDWFRAVD